jgi:MFS family permease
MLRWTYQRESERYPRPAVKYFYLAIVIISGIMVYFEDYAAGAVTPLLLPSLHMSLTFYSYLIVVFGVIGGAASYFGSFVDRFGRANMGYSQDKPETRSRPFGRGPRRGAGP